MRQEFFDTKMNTSLPPDIYSQLPPVFIAGSKPRFEVQFIYFEEIGGIYFILMLLMFIIFQSISVVRCRLSRVLFEIYCRRPLKGRAIMARRYYFVGSTLFILFNFAGAASCSPSGPLRFFL